MRTKIIPVFIPHASCPQTCIFCNQNKTTGVAERGYDSVKKTIQQGVDSLLKGKGDDSLCEIAFYGGSFTAIPLQEQESLLQIAASFLKKSSIKWENIYSHASDDRKIIDSIRVSTRPDYINEETLTLLAKHGVKTIELGAQSMSDEVLLANLRGHNSNDTIKASRMIKKRGFALSLQIVPGLYKDTKETIIKTVQECIKLQPDFMRIYPCLVIKETKLEAMWRAGEYKPLSLQEAIDICKVIYQKIAGTDIKIIRMGMHPEPDFIKNSFVAGPFHPAFKQLVISSIFYDMSDFLIRKISVFPENKIAFIVNKRDVSNFTGVNGSNIRRLKEKRSLDEIEIIQGEVKEGSLSIVVGDKRYDTSVASIEF